MILHNDRGIIAVSGTQAREFLHAITTNDIMALDKVCYGLFLNAQGRYLFDCFIIKCTQDYLLLDCHSNHVNDLMEHMDFYKLRRDVDITDKSNDYRVIGGDEELKDADDNQQVIASFIDPRNTKLGHRHIVTAQYMVNSNIVNNNDDHDLGMHHIKRMRLGVCEGYYDMISAKSIPLEYKMDDINGISFNKGCYIGQELTNRTKNQGVVRKMVISFKVSGTEVFTADGQEIRNGDDKKAGIVCSAMADIVFAKIRLEHMDEKLYVVGPTPVLLEKIIQ